MQARTVSLFWRIFDVDSVALRVAEDGRGFDGWMPQERGGLRSMRARTLLGDRALVVREYSRGDVEVSREVSTVPVGEPVGV